MSCRISPVASFLVMLVASSLAAQSSKGITVEQVLQLRRVTSAHVGDGFVAFSMSVPRPLAEGAGNARSHVGVFADLDAVRAGTTQPRMLISGKESASSLQVRPGQREISFAKSKDGKRQLFTLSIDGDAEPNHVADTPTISAYAWRPDGNGFAFTSLDPRPAARAAAQEAGIKPVIYNEDWRHLSLWVHAGAGEARKLTSDTTVFDFEWSPDGKRIACACAPRNLVDDSYMFKRLFVIDVATGKREQLADNPGKLGEFAWSPDGKRIAYISAADRNDPHSGSLYMIDVATKEISALTYGLRGMIEGVSTTATGFLVRESIGVRTRLRHLDPTGKDQWIFEAKKPHLAITSTSTGATIAFTASSHQHPRELFVLTADRKPVRLTSSNPVLKTVALGEQSVARFRARDRLPIEGLLIKPIGYTEGKRYPLVISVHGGPEAHNSNGWLTSYSQWGQLLAARGYVSWYPNYRASTGYGVEFCKKDHGDPMGREFEDHLDAIAHFDRLGLIDPGRVGIGGGSYGGYTAAWAATKGSEHFAAAVSFVPFVHIHTKWMTSDIPWEFYYVHYQEKWPWQQPGLLDDRSPLNWAHQCKTPLLLAGGTSDPRVHPSQPMMLYRAVSFATKTPVRYVQYPNEGHGNRKNVYRYDYALRSLRWFDHYLAAGDRRGAEKPAMDLDYQLPER